MTDNSWDNLAEYFSESNTSSADNTMLVEPIIIEQLKGISPLSIIDFGCGAGKFCRRISGISDKVLGIDSSPGMIEIAKRLNSTSNIKYTSKLIYETDISDYNVLNAEFVIQFLSDTELEKLLMFISKSNVRLIIISNHRSEFIRACLEQGKGNYSYGNGGYSITISGNAFPFYPRQLDAVYSIFKKYGFMPDITKEITFPIHFIDRYPEWKKKPIELPVHYVASFKR